MLPAGTPDDRLTRLAGNGSDTSGGGFALSDVFRAIFQRIIDHGSSTEQQFINLIKIVLNSRRNRIYTIWDRAEDPWQAIADDLLYFLKDGGYLNEYDGLLSLGPAFAEEKELTILPERPGISPAYKVTVYSKEERERRSQQDQAQLDLTLAKRHLENARKNLVSLKLDLAIGMVAEMLGMEDYTFREEEQQQVRPARNRMVRRPAGMIQKWVIEYVKQRPGRILYIQTITNDFNQFDAEAIASNKYNAAHSGVILQALDRLALNEPGTLERFPGGSGSLATVRYTPKTGQSAEDVSGKS